MASILLVCAANLCRSPMAEAVLQSRATALGLGRVASAGVRASSRPLPVDKRALAALGARGYALDKRWRSCRVAAEDFERHDLLLAMDHEVLDALRALRPAHAHARLALFLDGIAGADEVPDPYYGSAQGFERVLDLIEARAKDWGGVARLL